MAVTVKEIQELRAETSAGMDLCKEALESSKGDHEKALEFIRKKGAAKAEKRSGRTAAEGVIGVYHHGVDQRIPVHQHALRDRAVLSREDATPGPTAAGG